MLGRLAIVAAFSTLFPAAHADIWRWTDPASGEVVYGEHPPTDLSADAVKLGEGSESGLREAQQKAASTSADRVKARLDELRDQRLAREKEKQEAQARKEAQAQLESACQDAHSNLEALTTRGQAAIIEDGARRTLTEEERQQHIAKTREFLTQRCKP